jgi:hypothetical protein
MAYLPWGRPAGTSNDGAAAATPIAHFAVSMPGLFSDAGQMSDVQRRA